jgi:hypothetical protein
LIRAPENKPWCFGGTSGNKNIRHVVYAQATFDQDVIDAANKSSEGTSSTQTNKQYIYMKPCYAVSFVTFVRQRFANVRIFLELISGVFL